MMCAHPPPPGKAPSKRAAGARAKAPPSLGTHNSPWRGSRWRRAASASQPSLGGSLLPSVGACKSLQRAVGIWQGLAGSCQPMGGCSFELPAPLHRCLQVPAEGSWEPMKLGWLTPVTHPRGGCLSEPPTVLHSACRLLWRAAGSKQGLAGSCQPLPSQGGLLAWATHCPAWVLVSACRGKCGAGKAWPHHLEWLADGSGDFTPQTPWRIFKSMCLLRELQPMLVFYFREVDIQSLPHPNADNFGLQCFWRSPSTVFGEGGRLQ